MTEPPPSDASPEPASEPTGEPTAAPEQAPEPGLEPEPTPPEPLPPAPIAPGFELPGARQVVGRGLQLAYDSSRDLRRASLYVGLLMAAVAGPFAVLLLVDLPRMLSLSIANPEQMTRAEANALLVLIGPLYAAGALALLGFVTVSVDGFLIAVSILAGRAAGRPLRLREALARARQVFWRYGVAAIVVSVISSIVTIVVLFATGSLSDAASLGASLLASFVATIVVAPFGYIATSIVIGDVTGGAALRRSITLVRARPRLAVTVAAFAFAASALQTFGVGVAADVVTDVSLVLHPNLDLTGSGLLVAVPLVIVGLMALGSLGVTVTAVTSGPQVAAFLGLTHYTAGLDRARQADAMASASPEPRKPARTRWLTVPMAGLVILELIVVVSGIVGAVQAG